mmetsp:Transcript_18899/g.41160  ORF Transcript_18899/g.41160 Transcript_18899/m.41160 type:complete len:233 (+) Transcript_18899:779-1477(+)
MRRPARRHHRAFEVVVPFPRHPQCPYLHHDYFHRRQHHCSPRMFPQTLARNKKDEKCPTIPPPVFSDLDLAAMPWIGFESPPASWLQTLAFPILLTKRRFRGVGTFVWWHLWLPARLSLPIMVWRCLHCLWMLRLRGCCFSSHRRQISRPSLTRRQIPNPTFLAHWQLRLVFPYLVYQFPPPPHSIPSTTHSTYLSWQTFGPTLPHRRCWNRLPTPAPYSYRLASPQLLAVR